MHGYAVKLGERHGIPTPALFLVYAALKPYIGGSPNADSGTGSSPSHAAPIA